MPLCRWGRCDRRSARNFEVVSDVDDDEFRLSEVLCVVEMPEVVTHRYDPARGACLNVCSLADWEALLVLERVRRESRPTLKADYLERRRVTEAWLVSAARESLRRAVVEPPVYFFLGDFSFLADASRPASLVIPLSSLAAGAVTLTLGDSMSVAEEEGRRVYTLPEMIELFAEGETLAGFGFCDRDGFQKRFVEVQVWEPTQLAVGTARAGAQT
jgi:hypothetical protein